MTFYSCGMDIEYSVLTPGELDTVRGLWEKLRDHHASILPRFGASIHERTFEQRKQELLKKAETGKMQVFLAIDAIERRNIGYCIATVSGDGAGEIDSLYVEEEYRGREIGDRLMQSAVAWLDEHAAGRQTVSVLAGNEEVLAFYRRYGFYPRTYTLERVMNGEPDGS